MGNQEPLTNDKIKLNTAAKGNALIDAVKFSASQCVFDERITFLYANSCFYDSLGYTKEEYISLFPDFCQYYRNCPEEFQKLKEAVTSAVNNSRETFTADCRMPLKDGSFTRVHMNGSMTGEQVNGYPVFFIFYSDIHELIQEKEEKTIYFEWMMKEYMGNIYISDVDTYELLYVNDTSCKTLKASRSNIIGKLCYEVIQGRTSPCPFCTNKRLRTDKSYEWEYFNPILGRIFMIKNRLINWNGHRARIE